MRQSVALIGPVIHFWCLCLCLFVFHVWLTVNTTWCKDLPRTNGHDDSSLLFYVRSQDLT